jgi:hypothetical protein
MQQLTRLGFVIIHRYIEQQLWPAHLTLQPIFLGGVMGLSKNTPPGMNPFKGKYMMEGTSVLTRSEEMWSIL